MSLRSACTPCSLRDVAHSLKVGLYWFRLALGHMKAQKLSASKMPTGVSFARRYVSLRAACQKHLVDSIIHPPNYRGPAKNGSSGRDREVGEAAENCSRYISIGGRLTAITSQYVPCLGARKQHVFYLPVQMRSFDCERCREVGCGIKARLSQARGYPRDDDATRAQPSARTAAAEALR